MHTLVNFFKQHIVLTCKQATALASRSLDERLTFHERMMLKWHLFICTHCVKYYGQIKLIRKLAYQQHESAKLANEAKQRIAQAISEAQAPVLRSSQD